MGRYFGTDGIRGQANTGLNAETAFRIGRYLGWYFSENGRSRIVIGKDTRISSDMLEHALAAGIAAEGCDAYLIGVCPTPTVSYIVRTHDFACGVMVSASHNPFYDNGIKIFSNDGLKMRAEVEDLIEDYIDGLTDLPYRTMENIGKVVDAYEDERGLFVRAEFDADNPKAQYVRKLVKEGRLYQFSFAYQVLDAGTVELDSGLEAYELRKLDIFEVSLVQIPANQHAEVVEVKAATPEVKSGRRNSKADEDELRRVLDMANQIETIVQSLIGDEQDEPEPEPEDKPEEPEGAKGEDSTAKDALAQLKDEADRLLRQ